MARVIDSRHIGNEESRNTPGKNRERIPGIDEGTPGLTGVRRVTCRVKSPDFSCRLYFIQFAGKIEAFFCLKKNIPSLIRNIRV
jgi:hypothetical protein